VRGAFLCAAIGFASSACLAQEVCGIPKRGPSSDAAAAFEKIEDAVGIEPGRYLLYASSDQLVKDRSGAFSVECGAGRGSERWIVYDPELIKGDALYFALAHEIAHHLNNDPMSGEMPAVPGPAAFELDQPEIDRGAERAVTSEGRKRTLRESGRAARAGECRFRIGVCPPEANCGASTCQVRYRCLATGDCPTCLHRLATAGAHRRHKAEQLQGQVDIRLDSTRAFPDGLLAGRQGM